MSNQPNLTFIVDQITKLLIFLNRSPVQIQLLVILISILVSHSLSYWVGKKIKANFPQLAINLAQETTLAPYWCGLILIPDLVGRGFSLIVLNLFHNLFINQGWIAGILTIAINILWVNLFGSSVTIGVIIISTVGLYLWIVAVNILQYILWQTIINSTKIDSGGAQASLILVRYFLITFGIVIVIGYLGFNSTTFAAITGGLSVGIVFGLKEVFSNFISGIFLLFEGSLRPGDIIEIGGESSEVKKISMRATTVQVIRDNSEKIIPNQIFFTQELKTMTGSDRRVRKSLTVGVSYDCDPQKVIEILLEIIYKHPETLNDPAPLVSFINFGESSLDFEITVWLATPTGGKRIMSEIACEIWKVFAENNIEIPYPQRDLHIRSDIRKEVD